MSIDNQELKIIENSNCFNVELGNSFSASCSSRLEFIQIMFEWKSLFDTIGFDELFKLVSKDLEINKLLHNSFYKSHKAEVNERRLCDL